MVAENLETPRYTVSPSALYLHSEQHRQPVHSSRCRAGGCALSSQKQSRSRASALEIRSSGTPRPQVPTNVHSMHASEAVSFSGSGLRGLRERRACSQVSVSHHSRGARSIQRVAAVY